MKRKKGEHTSIQQTDVYVSVSHILYHWIINIINRSIPGDVGKYDIQLLHSAARDQNLQLY